ncbi:hypothetical protein [Maridesulfovibrio sp.]|uniref:hypothetical protein n=1 Tax=Maridesulfovibrio sp. TaxID=2795000 RepID=UPI003BABC115
MNKTNADHVADLMSAACALRTLVELAKNKDRYGEAFLLESIRKTVEEGAEAFDELESRINSHNENPVLQIVSNSGTNQDHE